MEFTNEMITELKAALKDKNLAPYHKRIQAVYLRSIHTPYKTIMDRLDISHDTIWRLTKKYQEHGLTSLTSEARGGRRHSYMTVEEEQAFLSEQLTSAVNGEFVTVESLYRAYQDKIGRTTTKDGFYQLLKRHGWVKESKDSLRREIKGAGKNSTGQKRVRLPAPAQLIRSDLECKTRTNLSINHCAEMLTRTLRSEIKLFAQPQQKLAHVLNIRKKQTPKPF
ncbi:helix-turn-helix domain-containing protein [Streptococcus suis]|nr:helix-turn-helix domain-containing protein [Streptococcus suis]MBY5030176.1 helix-turn-helix domain-containing protein [Streptococcus suis]